MTESNPYEAPANPAASNTLERTLATRLLEIREKGYSIGLFYRWQARGYLVLFIAFGVGIAFYAWLNLLPAGYVMLGVLVGVLLRDFGVARTQGKLWKTQTKLFDWDKVKRMASGEPID